MLLLSRFVVIANLSMGIWVLVGEGSGLALRALGVGAVAAVSLILWHVTPAAESDFGLSHLPEDHPVRERLEAKE